MIVAPKLLRGLRARCVGALTVLGLLCGCHWLAAYENASADATIASAADAADGGGGPADSDGAADTKDELDMVRDGDGDVGDDAGSCGFSAEAGAVSCGAVIGVAAGVGHACAVRAAGDVLCWGGNGEGQLGNGSGSGSFVPVVVTGIADAVQVAAGEKHTCARRKGGQVLCWGSNTGSTPQAVLGIQNATDLAAGGDWSCAIVQHEVWCWGLVPTSQVVLGCGQGNASRSQQTPAPAAGLSDATRVVIGQQHACALQLGGQVACWGTNDCGQLGDGTTIFRSTAVTVQNLANATVVTAGMAHTCSRSSGGAVHCWGRNTAGNLGDGTNLPTTTPVLATQLSPADAVAAGYLHTCILRGGQVTCRGSNVYGELGVQSGQPPGYVGSLNDAVEIEVGYYASFARRASGALVAWGYNVGGQLGDGTDTARDQAVVVVAP